MRPLTRNDPGPPRAKVRAAWEDILRPVPWDIIGHLTFWRGGGSLERSPPGRAFLRQVRPATWGRVQGAWNALVERLAHGLALGRRQQDVLWTRCYEPHADGELHVHFLAAAPAGLRRLTPQDVLDRWIGPEPDRPKIGRAVVESFDSTRADRAARYLTKAVDQGIDLDYSKAVSRWHGNLD